MSRSITARLNCRVELWEARETENELGQLDMEHMRLCGLWAEVLPVSGTEKSLPAGSLYAEVSHKITIRPRGGLKPGMYFIYNGQRYDIKWFMPNYQKKDRLELYCRLVVE